MERATADMGDGGCLQWVLLMANVGGGWGLKWKRHVSDMVVGILVKFDQKNLLAKDILHLGISTRFHVRKLCQDAICQRTFCTKDISCRN